MKKILILSALVVAGGFLGGCVSASDPYHRDNSSFFQKQRTKYDVVDEHVDCPQIVKQPYMKRK